MTPRFRTLAAAGAVLILAGCASINIDQAVSDTNQAAPGFTQGKLELSRTEDQRARRGQFTNELLAKPLSMDDAVQVALANSPTVQAMLAQGWADMAAASQRGRLTNPIFTFEHLRTGSELDIGRLLSIGIVDLLTWPQRQSISRIQVAQARVQMTADVVDRVSQVRQAWVRAVAAAQLLQYAQQVNGTAQASAELARRMQQVGNFTKLQRARQQAFYADSAAQLAAAQHAVTATREELVRQLGLDTAQAARLKLPERLPDIPSSPKSADSVAGTALQQRIDVQLARLQLDAAGKAQGLVLINSLVDIEAGVRRNTIFDNTTGEKQKARGYELDVRLPLFDWGGAMRASMNAQSLAAANRYDAVVRAASSQLRESYSAYRTAHDLAKHYRDEIVPLRKTISEENVLRYNGMLIGVFELLADSRDQVAAVMSAINAQQQFWLADAALSTSVIGKPVAMGATPVSTSTTSDSEGQGH